MRKRYFSLEHVIVLVFIFILFSLLQGMSQTARAAGASPRTLAKFNVRIDRPPQQHPRLDPNNPEHVPGELIIK